jgi:hypothetical protein
MPAVILTPGPHYKGERKRKYCVIAMKYSFYSESCEKEFVMPFAVPVRLPESQILCNIVVKA